MPAKISLKDLKNLCDLVVMEKTRATEDYKKGRQQNISLGHSIENTIKKFVSERNLQVDSQILVGVLTSQQKDIVDLYDAHTAEKEKYKQLRDVNNKITKK